MITIYGSPKTSSGRCFWTLEEVGAVYQAKTINFKEQEHKSEDFLKVNPNGKIPALVDGDYTIWESTAINFYLAEAYKPDFLGSSAKEKGLVHQWSIWSMVDLQPPIIEVFIQKVFIPEDKRDNELIKKSIEKLPAMLKTLNDGLEGKNFLLGTEFSLADINVHSVVSICEKIEVSLSDYPNIINWCNNISEVESYKKYQELCK